MSGIARHEHAQETSVQAIVDRYRGMIIDQHISFRPAIPADDLSSALEKFAQGVNPDDVLVLVDDAPLKGAVDGVVLTDTHLYSHQMARSPLSVPLAGIESVSFKTKWLGCELLVNGAWFMSFSCPKKENVRLFTQMLEEIVALGPAAAQQAAAPEGDAEAVREAAAALKDLKGLLDAGILTEEEFHAKSAKFLSRL